MSEPTLSLSNTTRPMLESVVLRERLFTQIEAGLDCQVTWIQGPPGAGKTTLVSSFLESRTLNHLWYEIDIDDNDVATFFYYLRRMLTKNGAKELGQGLPSFSSEHLGKVGHFARVFFRHMYDVLPQPCVFVLDNYQDVYAQSNLHDVVHAAIRELPAGVALVLMSRADPAPNMARLRANQQMGFVAGNDLRLTPAETQQMANLRGQPVSAEALDVLHHLTEGWAAGLVLLMEIPDRDLSHLDGLDTMHMEVIFDYFAEEAFNTFPATTQDFLLRAAFVPKLTPRMAVDLTGLEEAPRLLSELSRKNYFVSRRVTSTADEYQFHPLFREFLIKVARDRFSAKHFRGLQRDVAGLLRRSDQIESAVELFVEVAEWDHVAEIIESHAASMLAYGRSETLAQWLTELPVAKLGQNPWMLYWSAAACFHTAPRESRKYYQQAYEAFEAMDRPDIKGMVLACCGAVDTILLEQDDLALLEPWIVRMEALIERHPTFFRGKQFGRVGATMLMAVVMHQPQHPMLDSWIERASHNARANEDSHNRLIVAPLTALALLLAGRLNAALEIVRGLRAYSEAHPMRPQVAVMLSVLDAMYRTLSGNTEDCLRIVDEGLETAAAHGYQSWVNQLLVFGCGTALINKQLGKVTDYLDQLEARSESTNRIEKCLFRYLQAWAALSADDKVTAYQSFKLALSLAIEVGMPLLETLCRSGLARVAFDCNDRRTATAQMRKVHHLVREINNPLVEFQTLLTFAELALGDGRTTAGVNALRYGMSLGREHGFEHVMAWQPHTVANLCVRALEQGIEPDYVKRLISSSQLTPEVPPYHLAAWPWHYRIYSLGSFQLLKGSQSVTGGSRAKGRPLDLLKALVACGGKAIEIDHLARILWPHVDKEYAIKSLTINLHRLRKLFGDDDVVLLQDGRLTLDPSRVWFDLWALEQTFSDTETTFRKPLPAIEASNVKALARRTFELYRGPFFADDEQLPCYSAKRDEVHSRLTRQIAKLARFWEYHEAWEDAAACYEQAIAADRSSEGFYHQLMLCYEQLGRRTEALDAYERCRQSLSALARVAPSAETTALYQKLMSKG